MCERENGDLRAAQATQVFLQLLTELCGFPLSGLTVESTAYCTDRKTVAQKGLAHAKVTQTDLWP